MNFCNFCDCEMCVKGGGPENFPLLHAPTEDGRWICEVCYWYDECVLRGFSGPCSEELCEHRPRLSGEMI